MNNQQKYDIVPLDDDDLLYRRVPPHHFVEMGASLLVRMHALYHKGLGNLE
jgi:hypothetical protein